MKFQYTIDDAYASLCPGVNFHILNGTVTYWSNPDVPKPTHQQLVEEVAKLQATYDATEYQRLRAIEYPPVTDYLDAVVKGDLEQQQTYIDACLAVKAKYPKPEGV
jgi:hypothetical protein